MTNKLERPETPAGNRTGVFDTDRDAWLLKRKGGVGASEVSAILGKSQFSSALEVWASKVTEVPRVESEIMDWGHILEAPIIGEYAKRKEIDHVIDGEMIFSKKYPHAFATIDASTIGPEGPEAIECKTTSMGHLFPSNESDPKEVPVHIQIQLQSQLLVTGWSKNTCVWLPLPERVLGFRRHSAHEEFQALIGESIEHFWRSYVEKNVAPSPDGTSSAARAISLLYPEPQSVEALELNEENLARKIELEELKSDQKKLDLQIQKITQELQLLLKSNEVGSFPDGSKATYRKISPKPSKCPKCDHETLRKSYRALKFKKAK